MRSRFLSLFAAACLACNAGVLRVCADGNNLPFSNAQREGFDNKIVELVASDLGDTVQFIWLSERESFAKHTLGEGKCDVLAGVPTGLEDADTTEPYYRSSYVFVSPAARNLNVQSLLDPRLSSLRIGIQIVGENLAPPAVVLARRGIAKNVTGFSLFGKYGQTTPARSVMDAVENGNVDIAIVWGPLAGYFARQSPQPLSLAPVMPASFAGVPFTFQLSLAVRKGNEALKTQLDTALAHRETEIQKILGDYGVPQVH